MSTTETTDRRAVAGEPIPAWADRELLLERRLDTALAELEGQLRAMADQVAAHAELQQHAMLGWQAERDRRGDLERELARTRRQIARLTWWQRLLARLVP